LVSLVGHARQPFVIISGEAILDGEKELLEKGF
jgi:hypothetical protein